MAHLNELDKKLVIHLQENFPLTLRPFKRLAEMLSTTEEQVIARVRRLKSKGVIRRIGPTYNPEKLGYRRTLIGMSVPRARLKQVADLINRFSEVTHNYLREDSKFNLWFTLICPSDKRINAVIRQLKQKTAVKEILNLPTVKTIKIKAMFRP